MLDKKSIFDECDGAYENGYLTDDWTPEEIASEVFEIAYHENTTQSRDNLISIIEEWWENKFGVPM